MLHPGILEILKRKSTKKFLTHVKDLFKIEVAVLSFVGFFVVVVSFPMVNFFQEQFCFQF